MNFKIISSISSFRSPENSQLKNHFYLKTAYESIEIIDWVEYSFEKAMRYF